MYGLRTGFSAHWLHRSQGLDMGFRVSVWAPKHAAIKLGPELAVGSERLVERCSWNLDLCNKQAIHTTTISTSSVPLNTPQTVHQQNLQPSGCFFRGPRSAKGSQRPSSLRSSRGCCGCFNLRQLLKALPIRPDVITKELAKLLSNRFDPLLLYV